MSIPWNIALAMFLGTLPILVVTVIEVKKLRDARLAIRRDRNANPVLKG